MQGRQGSWGVLSESGEAGKYERRLGRRKGKTTDLLRAYVDRSRSPRSGLMDYCILLPSC